ncbi:MAG: hypothetical protein ACI4UE_05970 [Candidatus Scatovivens sp.]
MNENTTNASNDESRKEATTRYVSDEKVKKLIEEWDDGKGVYLAAVDAEFLTRKDKENNTSQNSSSSSSGGSIKVTTPINKKLEELKEESSFVTVGTKPENGKHKKARADKKAREDNNKNKEKESDKDRL